MYRCLYAFCGDLEIADSVEMDPHFALIGTFSLIHINSTIICTFILRGNLSFSISYYDDSYEYCVAGHPCKSVIAINSMGVLKYHFSIGLWLKGYRYVVEKLNPLLILRYGPKIPGEYEDISMYLDNEQLNILRNGSKRK